MTDTTHFYRPTDGWFGDVMPIVQDDTCHLFYTQLGVFPKKWRHDF